MTFVVFRFCVVIVTRVNRGSRTIDYGKGSFSLVWESLYRPRSQLHPIPVLLGSCGIIQSFIPVLSLSVSLPF